VQNAAKLLFIVPTHDIRSLHHSQVVDGTAPTKHALDSSIYESKVSAKSLKLITQHHMELTQILRNIKYHILIHIYFICHHHDTSSSLLSKSNTKFEHKCSG